MRILLVDLAVCSQEFHVEKHGASANSSVGSSRHLPPETRADRLELLDFPTILFMKRAI